jgi:hypothetical protein
MSTGNVPNKNSFFRGLDNFLLSILFFYEKVFFTFSSGEMSAASNGAKIS